MIGSDTDSDSAWVNVLTPWAGDNSDSNYGVRFLPHAGELVVIDFLDGNADQPMVVGRIHEGARLPTQFDHQGSLPDTRALSGIKTQELNSQGFNQLRFDDTTGQISAQLQSSHAASQLNLGHLSHPKVTDTSNTRGEGFELRTDQFGAIRAGKGLLLSTHAQDKAKANHLDTVEAKSQLDSTLNSITALSDMAKRQNADPLDVLEDLQSFISQLQHQSPEQAATFKSAIMLLSSPQSVGISSQANVNISADGHISQSTGDSINMSTQDHLIAHAQQKISLFAGQKGITATAAKGKIALQAQGDGIEAIARKVIQIISTEDRIEITSPKEISLTAGGSQILLGGQGVLIKTGGKFEAKAGQHVFSGAASARAQSTLPPPPKRGQGMLELLHDYKHGNFVKQGGYKVVDNLGQKFTGQLDDNGFMSISGLATGAAKVIFEDDMRNPWEESSDFKRPPMWPNENDPEAQPLLAKAKSKMGSALTAASETLGKALVDPSSILKTIETAKQLQHCGAKSLLPLISQSAESKLASQISNFLPESLNSNLLGKNTISGIGGNITMPQSTNPLRRENVKHNLNSVSANIMLNTINNKFK